VVVCLSESDGDLFTKPHPASSLMIDEKTSALRHGCIGMNAERRFTETLPSCRQLTIRSPVPVTPRRNRREASSDLRLDIEQETLLENFISQISSSLEREQLNDLTRKTLIVAESERLYKNSLNRSPTSSNSNCDYSRICRTSDGQRSARRGSIAELAQEIHQAGSRLNHFVANLAGYDAA